MIVKSLSVYKDNFIEYSLILKLQKRSLLDSEFSKFQHYTNLEQYCMEKLESSQKSSFTLLKDFKNHLEINEQIEIEEFIKDIEVLKKEVLDRIKENLDLLSLKRQDFSQQIDNISKSGIFKGIKVNFNKINSQIISMYG